MANFAPLTIGRSGKTLTGTGCILTSLIAMNLGAALAKHLFPLIGAYGVTAMRISLAALVLMLLNRPWRRPVPASLLPGLIGYGAALGLMNVLIYQAFARLPIGIATGIEVLGPLSVVLLRSRSAGDLVWLASAMTGLALLLPLRSQAGLDLLGLAFASSAAICWALYIVFGKRVAEALGRDAVAWGMLVAAVITAPVGLAASGTRLFDPALLALGFGVALLSSVLPYSLEMEAMRRLPTHLFGTLLSSAPAVAAVGGFIVLGEVLTGLQWVAILLIVIASGGAARSAMTLN